MASPSSNNKYTYGSIPASSSHNSNYMNKHLQEEDKTADDEPEHVSTSSRITSVTISLTVSAMFMAGLFLIATSTNKSYIQSNVDWLTSQFSTTNTVIQPIGTTSTSSTNLPVNSFLIPGVPSAKPTAVPGPPTLDPSRRPSKSPTVKPTRAPTTSEQKIEDVHPGKPNFILIVADDLAWNSIGYNGDEMADATPNLTKLAQQGIIMDNFYAQEVCSPSRGSLLTGRYPLSIGMQYGMVAANAEWGLSLDEVTLADVFQDNSYSTHMLGKWHIGYFSPLFLPTARGFDSWIGYANGENYYWSKKSPDYPEFVDFIESDKSCYRPYNGTDRTDYSTQFYTSKAVNIIEEHAVSDPLFLYVAYQAVHDPFVDYGKHSKGVPTEYIDDDVLDKITTKVVGRTRQEYAKSLYLLDKGVGEIYDALVDRNMMDDTYIIFMSDNGGCHYGGGKNGPYRGSKGSLFEGAIKVTSFIYSPKLSNTGTVYTGLMHVSDWFPTMLALSGITYVSDDDHPLDGVNQVDGWKGSKTPRSNMLYNMYTHLTDYDYNVWTNGSFAVRDSRFKLMHTYDDSVYGNTWDVDAMAEDDDDLESEDKCAQQFVTGSFTYWLFDLREDPYETNNLYDSTETLYVNAKDKLYNLLPGYSERAKTKIAIEWSSVAEDKWQNEYNGNILPWADSDSLVNSGDCPVYCP